MLKFAHNSWVLCCHSFWCVVFTSILLFIIYMLVKCVIMKASHLFSICRLPPNFCHVLLLQHYFGARANLGNTPEYAIHVSVIHYIHHPVGENMDSRAVGLEDNRTPNSINLKKDPLDFTHKSTKGCAFLQYAALLRQRILRAFARLLMWNVLYSFRFMKKYSV